MLEAFNTDKFEYKRLSQDEQKKRGILGRLVGKIADTKNPTRNGRLYSSTLWENVFNDPIMKEKIENHLLLGELAHPSDREEIDPAKAAICMAELPKKGKDGYLYGVFDIIDTPNGRILKSLCDYGCNVAISSRGTGDIVYDENGNESVDPDTYQCETFDIVLVPGVEQARLQYVTESLNTKKYGKTLKQKLSEEIEKASDSDKKVMTEALENLNIKLDEGKLVKPSEEDIDAIKQDLSNIGFKVDREGETWLGNKHLQLILDGENHNAEDLHTVAVKLNEISDKWDGKNIPITYNVGLTSANEITCGLDIRDKYVEGVDEQFYLNRDKEKDAVDALRTKIDPAKLRDDALSLLKHSDLEALCRKYDVTTDVQGKEKLGVNILTPDEMEAKFGVRSLNDIKEELQNEEGWGDYINDESEYLFNELESLMYEIRNCRRGSYAGFGDTVPDLAEELNRLSDALTDLALRIDYNETELTEKCGEKDAKLKENIPTEKSAQRELIGKLYLLNQMTNRILEYDRNFDFNEEENELVKKNLNDTLEGIKKIANKLNDTIGEDCSDKEDSKINETVVSDKDDLVKELQEALVRSAQLEKDNLSLREQLSVCGTKEIELKEELAKSKKAIINLSNSSKDVNILREQIEDFGELLNKKDTLLESSTKELHNLRSKLHESVKTSSNVEKLNKEVKSLQEKLDEADNKLSTTKKLVEKYKKTLDTMKNSYIKSQSLAYGINENDVRSLLKESYSLKDIDSLCEELYEQKLNLSKLPFSINENTKLGFIPSKNERLGRLIVDDDVVSENLLRMIN